MTPAGVINWRGQRPFVDLAPKDARRTRVLGPPVYIVDWRAQRPMSAPSPTPVKRIRVLDLPVYLIDWRSYLSSGTTSPDVLVLIRPLDGTGVGGGLTNITGPINGIEPEVGTGVGGGRTTVKIGVNIKPKGGGVGSGTVFFEGGLAPITCVASGVVDPAAPALPALRALADAPSSY